MLSLVSGRRTNLDAGIPILNPFGSLVATETHIRRGQLTLVAAPPGLGKSALIQNWLQRGDGKGNKNTVLYFSADSDASTMYKRGVSIASGYDQTEVDRLMRERETAGIDAKVMEDTSQMSFVFTSSPTDSQVLREFENFFDVFGDYPEVAVMDNLKNLYLEEGTDDEFGALEESCVFLHDLAKDTGTALIALHHVTGMNESGNAPIGLTGIRGKVSKTPEVIFTLWRQAEGTTNMSVVKNRNGQANPSGGYFLQLKSDLARMAFEG